MRARGQGIVALAFALVLVGAGLGAARLGPKAPGPAQPGEAPSGAWLCPHGGGTGWAATVTLANPGPRDVAVRLTSLSSAGARPPVWVRVPAGAEVAQTVRADQRSSATFVEYFGGWIAAGWTVRAGGGESGLGAEPCAAATAASSIAGDNDTEKGQDAYVVVMNPFAATAIVNVVLYTPDRAPIRSSSWTDLTVPPRRSVALRLNDEIPGETAVAAELTVTAGRVAMASLGVSSSGGVRSALATDAVRGTVVLPVAGGAGQSQLLVTVPNRGASPALRGTILTGTQPSPVNGLIGATQGPETVRVYPVLTRGPAAVVVTARGAAIAAALRSTGPAHDDAATGGVSVPAWSWVVPPTSSFSHTPHPGLVLVDPGTVAADVTLHLLAPDGADPAADVTVHVPAGAVVAAPAGFLASAPGASVLVRAHGAPVVALGASDSPVDGSVDYALAAGVPMPS